MSNHIQSDAFLKLAAEARARVREITVEELAREGLPPGAVLVDVRESDEFAAGRLPGAVHASRGVIEQRVGDLAPDASTPIVCYCAGGNRSALAADSLQRMGYTRVISLKEGFRGWSAAGLPVDRGPSPAPPPNA